MTIHLSTRIRKKLEERHGVTEEEIRQCFRNLEGEFLADDREEHRTNPPTYWFIAETNTQRKLKIVFIASAVQSADGARKTRIDIKTAYPPNAVEIDIYERCGKC
jgi:hypothetical protein